MLLITTNDRLKNPQFASAAMGRDEDGEYRLFVFWLQSTPSVDGIDVGWAKTNVCTLAISPYDNDENSKASKVSIVMVASWVWSNTNSIVNRFDQIQDVSTIEVRLLKKVTPLTGWYSVPFYRLDHWMGSKKITEVTSGPASATE